MVMYNIYGFAVPIVVLATMYAFRWKAGLWGNCVTLGVVCFSILIAVGWWEDVAELLARQAPAILFLADCIAIWALFLLSLLILDTATRFMSTVKVNYHGMVEKIGNGIVIFLLSVVLLLFHYFANGHLGMVGERHDTVVSENASRQIGVFRILSAQGDIQGNLAPFTQGYQFDDDRKMMERHLKRRQAIMLTMQNDDGQLQGKGEQVEKMKRRGRN